MSERGGECRPAVGKHLLELDVLAEADDAALLGRAVARLVLDPVVVLDVRARAAERRVLAEAERRRARLREAVDEDGAALGVVEGC